MLLTEWNWDDAKEVWREEALEEGREIIARNALVKGSAVDFVHEITGLSLETVEKLKAEM